MSKIHTYPHQYFSSTDNYPDTQLVLRLCSLHRERPNNHITQLNQVPRKRIRLNEWCSQWLPWRTLFIVTVVTVAICKVTYVMVSMLRLSQLHHGGGVLPMLRYTCMCHEKPCFWPFFSLSVEKNVNSLSLCPN